LEKVRLQRKREEEAEERRQAHFADKAAEKAAEKAGLPLPRKPIAPPLAARTPSGANSGESTPWRRGANVAPSATPPRAESPVPTAQKWKPGSGAGGGWRAKEEARKAAEAAGTPPPRPAAKEEPKKDEDGFQTVKSVYRPKQLRG